MTTDARALLDDQRRLMSLIPPLPRTRNHWRLHVAGPTYRRALTVTPADASLARRPAIELTNIPLAVWERYRATGSRHTALSRGGTPVEPELPASQGHEWVPPRRQIGATSTRRPTWPKARHRDSQPDSYWTLRRCKQSAEQFKSSRAAGGRPSRVLHREEARLARSGCGHVRKR